MSTLALSLKHYFENANIRHFLLQYYFGDANISRDKFLLEEAKKDEGWIPLTVLLTFNRLKCLSEDHAVIMNALRKSTDDLLEVYIKLYLIS